MMKKLTYAIKKCHLTLLLLSLAGMMLSSTLKAQSYYVNENNQFQTGEKYLYRPGAKFHTSIKNYRIDETNPLFNYDSTLYQGLRLPREKSNIFRRFFNDDLLRWKGEDYRISINPLFSFEAGQDKAGNENTFVNTRGLFIEGTIGKNVAFYADVLENQGSFPNYIDAFIQKSEVVPGQGKAKHMNYNATSQTYDYSQATGYISYQAGNHFNFQLGHGKNFIGDGYRSMLLSDVGYSYPYLKFTTSVANVKYQIMWASMTHLEREGSGDTRYPVKYGVFHYLDWNLGKRFTVGLYEAIIWADQDSLGNKRGFDYHYATPFVFYRPVEYSIGSPDNAMIGMNAKFIAAKWLTLYGQVMLDEFKQDEVFSGKKWWANKQGFQAGFKTFDLLGIQNLRWQVEYNQARPYTYTYYTPTTNYGHYNQPLAHPMGANFREGLTILSYHHKRLYTRFQFSKALYGKNTDNINYGGDIFIGSNSRPTNYGHFIGQGLKTNMTIADASFSYLINPRNNMNITLGYRYRKESNSKENLLTKFIYFGIRTSIKNLYYDF
jgi:hypothetical protein